MKATNLEVFCILKPVNVFSEKTQKYYPCVAVDFPDGTTCKVFDNRLLTTLLSSIYLNQINEEGGDAK